MSDTLEVQLTRLDAYRFRVDFGADSIPALEVDEGPPLGKGAGPSPTRLLATALAQCLSSSLIFCLGRSRVEVGTLAATAAVTLVRNERKRLRIGRIDVVLRPELPGAEPGSVRPCLEMFEDFCVVTASVRQGLAVGVRVEGADGSVLYERKGETPG